MTIKNSRRKFKSREKHKFMQKRPKSCYAFIFLSDYLSNEKILFFFSGIGRDICGSKDLREKIGKISNHVNDFPRLKSIELIRYWNDKKIN